MMYYRCGKLTLLLFIAFSLNCGTNADDGAITTVSSAPSLSSTPESTTLTKVSDQPYLEVQEKNVQLSVEGLEEINLAQCPMKHIEDLVIVGENNNEVVLPQLECVECGRSCGGDGKGECVQLMERVKEQLWKRGCVCQEPKTS